MREEAAADAVASGRACRGGRGGGRRLLLAGRVAYVGLKAAASNRGMQRTRAAAPLLCILSGRSPLMPGVGLLRIMTVVKRLTVIGCGSGARSIQAGSPQAQPSHCRCPRAMWPSTSKYSSTAQATCSATRPRRATCTAIRGTRRSTTRRSRPRDSSGLRGISGRRYSITPTT